MKKLFTVVKREYLQRVRSKLFIVATLLGPFVMSFFAIVPALIFSIDAGGPDHIVVVDQTAAGIDVMQRNREEITKTIFE